MQISHRSFNVAGSVVLYCVVHTLQMMKSRWSAMMLVGGSAAATKCMLQGKINLRDKVTNNKIYARGFSGVNIRCGALAFSSMWYSASALYEKVRSSPHAEVSVVITSLSPHASLAIEHCSSRTALLYVGLFGRNVGSWIDRESFFSHSYVNTESTRLDYQLDMDSKRSRRPHKRRKQSFQVRGKT